jgi:hypothetical protein
VQAAKFTYASGCIFSSHITGYFKLGRVESMHSDHSGNICHHLPDAFELPMGCDAAVAKASTTTAANLTGHGFKTTVLLLCSISHPAAMNSCSQAATYACNYHTSAAWPGL